MDAARKTLKVVVVTSFASLALLGESFAQNDEKSKMVKTREIELTRLGTVIPQSFNSNGQSIQLYSFDRDTVIVETLLPPSFASEVVITIHDQIRREQQNSDESILRRQKGMVEGIKRKK